MPSKISSMPADLKDLIMNCIVTGAVIVVKLYEIHHLCTVMTNVCSGTRLPISGNSWHAFTGNGLASLLQCQFWGPALQYFQLSPILDRRSFLRADNFAKGSSLSIVDFIFKICCDILFVVMVLTPEKDFGSDNEADITANLPI